MGLFDKIFEKKICSICGGEIGLLGNRKLEDGNCCKTCAAKLSPFFSDRRSSTVEEIKQQLAYREANKAEVAKFKVTRTIGTDSKKILLDEDARRFVVTSARTLPKQTLTFWILPWLQAVIWIFRIARQKLSAKTKTATK